MNNIQKSTATIQNALPDFKPKIYIRREDATYRKIINEADLIEK